ncbi:hypothetical protein [Teredinibacter waterburyi]|uniref:hypothetical protein n=1 Tax=Teredinibacter waterburyi TaxID=1500538 RepID=UPI00165F06C5|nr:hypothetical protein [Teredinibacter waterburyi]
MNVLINSPDIKLSEAARENIRCNVLFTFSRFQNRIDDVELHIKDINGPKGGEDKQCVLNLKGRGKEPIVISGKGENVTYVVDKCLSRAKSVISRKLKMKELHRERRAFFENLEANPYD